MKKLVILLLSISSIIVSAQKIQPSMMVIPYTDRGELALEMYEGDQMYRSIIAGIEKTIIDRGGTLQDLQPLIQNAREQMLRQNGSAGDKIGTDNILDLMYMKNEITVAAEITYNSSGRKITIGVRLKAVDPATGTVLYAGGLVTSPPLPSSIKDFEKITMQTLTSSQPKNGIYIDKFLNKTQIAFAKMREYGQEFTVIIKTDNNSKYFLNDKANDGEKLISEKIDEWAASKAVNRNFRYEKISEKYLKRATLSSNLISTPKMMKIRVPYRTDKGKPYNMRRFQKELRIAILKICKQARVDSGYMPDRMSMKPFTDRRVVMITMPSIELKKE